MRDFAHSLREFAEWKGDEPRRKRFLERLVGITKRRVHKSIANAVLLEHYNRVDPNTCFMSGLAIPLRCAVWVA